MTFNLKSDSRVQAGDAQEGQTTAFIESYTSQVPSAVFLGAAAAAIVGSLILKASERNGEAKNSAALFVGQWVAPFLILGLYNKMVKQHGSDATVRP